MPFEAWREMCEKQNDRLLRLSPADRAHVLQKMGLKGSDSPTPSDRFQQTFSINQRPLFPPVESIEWLDYWVNADGTSVDLFSKTTDHFLCHTFVKMDNQWRINKIHRAEPGKPESASFGTSFGFLEEGDPQGLNGAQIKGKIFQLMKSVEPGIRFPTVKIDKADYLQASFEIKNLKTEFFINGTKCGSFQGEGSMEFGLGSSYGAIPGLNTLIIDLSPISENPSLSGRLLRKVPFSDIPEKSIHAPFLKSIPLSSTPAIEINFFLETDLPFRK